MQFFSSLLFLTRNQPVLSVVEGRLETRNFVCKRQGQDLHRLDLSRRLYYISIMKPPDFEWDDLKNIQNLEKHGVSFSEAQYAFADPQRVIIEDLDHGDDEERFFCFGRVKDGVMTVRFTVRKGRIRIIGAGYWRKGKKIYEQENQVHR